MILECLEPSLCDLVVSSFDGDLVDGKYGGYGSLVLDNGNIYDGEFSNGLFHGKGCFTSLLFFLVVLLTNLFTGRFTWINGVVYDGDFVYGKFTGQGTYTWPDNSTYTGLCDT